MVENVKISSPNQQKDLTVKEREFSFADQELLANRRVTRRPTLKIFGESFLSATCSDLKN